MVDDQRPENLGLAVSDVVVRRGKRDVLNIHKLVFRPGQSVAIVGPNGAGKSTLLQVLSGLLSTAEGQILLDGRPLSSWSARELATRRGYLSQHFVLNAAFSVTEVVALGRSPYLSSLEIDRQVVSSAIKAVGLSDLAQRPYPSLSGGEQQRVHLARVLAQLDWGLDATADAAGTRWLLLDEPTASLDLGKRVDVLRVCDDIKKVGVGVLAVIHDLNLALRYFDRVVLLHHGKLEADGPPEKVLTRDMLETVYATPLRLIQDGRGGRVIVEA